MKALLPFAWERLSLAAQEDLAAARANFLCHSFLKPEVRRTTAPQSLPDFLLFTSANGVHAVIAQDWFRPEWFTLPIYAVGLKTGAVAEQAGFQVRLCLPPPAPDILTHLPTSSSQGLWLSGEEIAHDLAALAPGQNLQRQVAYAMHRDEVFWAGLQKDLEKYKIRSICVISERTAQDLSERLPSGSEKSPQLAVALSERLATITRARWPGIEVRVVQDLESGVRVLYNDLYAHP